MSFYFLEKQKNYLEGGKINKWFKSWRFRLIFKQSSILADTLLDPGAVQRVVAACRSTRNAEQHQANYGKITVTNIHYNK